MTSVSPRLMIIERSMIFSSSLVIVLHEHLHRAPVDTCDALVHASGKTTNEVIQEQLGMSSRLARGGTRIGKTFKR